MEVLEPGRTAQRSPAWPAAIQAPGLFPQADLAQLDARTKTSRQVAHQRPEVHPLLGGEIEGDAVARERGLDLGQVHLELAHLDALVTIVERLGLARAVVVLLVEVFFGRFADDLAGHVAGALEADQLGIAQMDGPEGFSVLAAHDHRIAQREPQGAGIEEELLPRAAQRDLDDFGHGRILLSVDGIHLRRRLVCRREWSFEIRCRVLADPSPAMEEPPESPADVSRREHNPAPRGFHRLPRAGVGVVWATPRVTASTLLHACDLPYQRV